MLDIRIKNFESILFQRYIFQFYYMSEKSQDVILYSNLDIISALLNTQTFCSHMYIKIV